MDKAVFYASFGRDRDSLLCEKRVCRAVRKRRRRKPTAFVPHQGWWVLLLPDGAEAFVRGYSPLHPAICPAKITCIWVFFLIFYRNFRGEPLIINILIA